MAQTPQAGSLKASGWKLRCSFDGMKCYTAQELEAALTGDPIDIAFNAKYITDVIRNITDDELCMKFNSNVSPCVVCPMEGDQYVYLILPVRVFQ